MPGRNGTGPMGNGSMTGRGLGPCRGANAAGYGTGQGLGLACRRGFGRGFGRYYYADPTSIKTQRELLEGQKEVLRSRLEVIDKQLENL
ncbi:MAG: DUF5320 domain-containing protein [Christensenellales bacterium]